MWSRWLEGEPDSLPEEPLFCPYCGTTISSQDLFCPRCGGKVERGAVSPGWRWWLGLAILAMALLLCILGIGLLGVLHGLEERSRLGQKTAFIYGRGLTQINAPQAVYGDRGWFPMVVGGDRLEMVIEGGLS